MNHHVPVPAARRQAFTLVELLVVIGIIALLISILLPSLNKARRSANTVKCSANLHAIMQGVQIYAANNKDWIPGSGWTSGRFLFNATATGTNTTYTTDNCPNIVQSFDWESPVAAAIGVRAQVDDTAFVPGKATPHFNSGADAASRLSRFEFLRKYPPFTCSENQAAVWTGYMTPTCSTDIAISYAMAEEFLLEPTPAGVTYGTGLLYTGTNPVLPTGYAPKLGKIKSAQSKICMADGSRYLDCTKTDAPDYSLAITGSGGGSYSDAGAFTTATKAWSRGAPGRNLGITAVADFRPIIYRHGVQQQGGSPGRYLLNVAFYDGHVETMDDVTSANPALWIPSGARLTVGSGSTFGAVWSDVGQKYGYTSGSVVTIP